MKNSILIISFILISFGMMAQIPAGYYNGTENLSGTALKSALHNIIDNHSSVSYSSLWNHFQTTDKTSTNKVWDVYSDIPGSTPPYTFTFGTDQCGNYSQEGDCYNREHSWPQSWFNENSPMVTDMFHIYPTDGYVNGQRGSYPFGEVGSASWTSQNGSKRGTCTYPGYSSICFEPIDEYKGDLARSYFYMSTRYYGEDSGWATNSAVDGAEIQPWSQNMFMEWHINDPVSTKEIDRNNAIYGIQNNRNPFIDHPEFAILMFSSNYPQPVFSGTPVTVAQENSYYEYAFSATDSYGNPIVFSADILPAWLNLVDNGNNTAVLSGTPGASDVGQVNMTLKASNLYSPSVEQSFTLNVSLLTGFDQLTGPDATIHFYPHPVQQLMNIDCGSCYEESYELSVMNVLGELVLANNVEFSKGKSSIPLSGLKPGIYFISLRNGNLQYILRKFVKE
ncbi:MAG: endonuclease [Bacteroidales bacterium]|nr:endonuclease [Bacteroidales bacterium]MCF8454918.1 endonuclease [Bacteroidales bacterium]